MAKIVQEEKIKMEEIEDGKLTNSDLDTIATLLAEWWQMKNQKHKNNKENNNVSLDGSRRT